MKYYDCHCHINFAAFKDEVTPAVKCAREADVGMIVVGTQYDTSAEAVRIAEAHEDVYAAIGLHPIHTAKSYHDAQELGAESPPAGGFTSRGEIFDVAAYDNLCRSDKVIGIGECGLDYYRLERDTSAGGGSSSGGKKQEETFIQQIELANRIGKPLMLHIRASHGTNDAYEDALALLKSHAKVKGDVHFFAGDWTIAKQFLDFGFTLSFTGVLTFARDYDEVVKNTPLDMLLSETDAPYVAPVPYRGKRNEPAYVTEVVKAIAEIRREPHEKVRDQLARNARRVFGLQ